MVIYICEKCNKKFNKKSNYITHTENKKLPCRPNQDLIHNNPKLIQTNPNLIQNKLNLENLSTDDLNETSEEEDNNEILETLNAIEQGDIKGDHMCNYCGKTFYNGANLNKHLRYNCKVKKEDDENKENIFKLLLEKERLIEKEKNEKYELKNILDEQKNELTDLKKQLIELTKTISALSKKTTVNNINKGIINNITITSEQLSQFGKENLDKIDQKDFIKIKNQYGIGIFRECARLIYNNAPENKTVFVSDVSRKKAMIWDGKNWILSDLEDVLYIIKEKVRDLYNINLDNINDKEIIDDFEKRVQKYFNMLYDEYDEDNKYDKKFMSRVKNLQEKFEDDLIKWLFNIKKDVLENYNTILKYAADKKFLQQSQKDNI